MNYVWFLLERSAFSDAQFSRAAQMMNAIREASTRMHEGVTLRQVLIQEKVIPEHLTDYISDEMN